jgi:hypothetical protein
MRAHALLRVLGALVLPGVVGVLFAEAQACNPACTGPEREFTGGDIKRGTEMLVYETAPPEGPFLPFEGAADYHIRHRLGVTPTLFEIDLSFNDHPEDPTNGGFSGWAGNQGIILSVDACEIRIRNDTCSDFFVRVVLTAVPGLDPDAGTSSCNDLDDAGDAAIDGASESSTDATDAPDGDAATE